MIQLLANHAFINQILVNENPSIPHATSIQLDLGYNEAQEIAIRFGKLLSSENMELVEIAEKYTGMLLHEFPRDMSAVLIKGNEQLAPIVE